MPATSHPTTDKTLVRWRAQDTPNGVTKRTVAKASATLGMTESQLIHAALASYISRQLPQFESNLEPLGDNVYEAIARRVPQSYSAAEVVASLID